MENIEILYQYWNSTSRYETLSAIGAICIFVGIVIAAALLIEFIEYASKTAHIITAVCVGCLLIGGIISFCLAHENGEELYYEVRDSSSVRALLTKEDAGWDFVDRRGSIVTITQHETR